MSRLIPIAAVLIALGLFFGYINPTMTGPIAETKRQISDYENALSAAERFRQKEEELAADRAAIPPESLVLLESFLPDGVDNVQLILDLDALAASTGLVLSEFTTTELETEDTGGIMLDDGSPVDSIELSTSGTGSYASFRAFMDAAEQSLRPLDLIELQIDTSENGVHRYQITYRLYWLR